MINICRQIFLATVLLLLVRSATAETFTENFTVDPLAVGWKRFGDTNLFAWNATNQNLEVTWDSSHTNSFFYHPLGNVLAKSDDFSFAFDLFFKDITGGVSSNKTGPFQIVLGFFNFVQATNPAFRRGVTSTTRNLVEFDYFPTGYYPDFGNVKTTISPVLISSNRQFAYNFTVDLPMTTNDWFHVELHYTATNRTLATTMTRNGAPFGPINPVTLGGSFSDFRVDTFSISSFSDVGDPFDSLLAHGIVDNVVITTPPPPVTNLTGDFTNQFWQVQFTSRTNWSYTLERSGDFVSWTTVSSSVTGNGGALGLSETNAPQGSANFYRVNARRQ